MTVPKNANPPNGNTRGMGLIAPLLENKIYGLDRAYEKSGP